MMFNKDAGKGGVTGIIERKEHKKLKAYQAELKGVASRRTDAQTQAHYEKKAKPWNDKYNDALNKAKIDTAARTGKPYGEGFDDAKFKAGYEEKNGKAPIVYTKTSDANDARKKEYLHQMEKRKLGGGKIEEAFPGSPGQNTALGQLKEAANIAQFWRAGSRASEIEAMEKLEKMSKKQGEYQGDIDAKDKEIELLKGIKTAVEKIHNEDKNDPSSPFHDSAKSESDPLRHGMARFQTQMQDIDNYLKNNPNMPTSERMKQNKQKQKLSYDIEQIKRLQKGEIARLESQKQTLKTRQDQAGEIKEHKEEKHQDHDEPHTESHAPSPKGGGHDH